MKLVRISEEAFYCEGSPIAMHDEDIAFLRSEVNRTARKRIRICTHPDVDAKLHEMFVCYTKDTKIAPHKHLGKDETFYVMEGEMDFITYDDDGKVRNVLPMGDTKSGKAFCVRVPMDTYHSVKLHSEFCVLHESTPGPFRPEDTLWARWN